MFLNFYLFIYFIYVMICSYFKEFIADLLRVQGLAGHGITNNTQSWAYC